LQTVELRMALGSVTVIVDVDMVFLLLEIEKTPTKLSGQWMKRVVLGGALSTRWEGLFPGLVPFREAGQ
jgi:hypothetical protein